MYSVNDSQTMSLFVFVPTYFIPLSASSFNEKTRDQRPLQPKEDLKTMNNFSSQNINSIHNKGLSPDDTSYVLESKSIDSTADRVHEFAVHV